MQRRRIVLKDFAGRVIKSLDISDVDHANTQYRMTLEVQTQCDMLHWHANQEFDTVPWGQRLRLPDGSPA
jgi:hypothetical protein